MSGIKKNMDCVEKNYQCLCEAKLERERRMCEAKKLFEGEYCALSCNSDDDWYDNDGEEFVFDVSNAWFEQALEEGLKEKELMERGYPEKNMDRQDYLKKVRK